MGFSIADTMFWNDMQAWWILIACWGSAFSQTDVPLFGPKQGRTAFQNLHVPELHADGTVWNVTDPAAAVKNMRSENFCLYA